MNNWRNRIIGHGVQPASWFLANPKNWRVHPTFQQESLQGALEEIGWIEEVTVNQETGFILDGHLRVTLALREGDETPVPVTYVELSEQEESLAILTKDPIAALAASDRAKASDILQDIHTENKRMQALLEDIARRERLIRGNAPASDPGPQIDKGGELAVKWGTCQGQKWVLGNHVVRIADATQAGEVAALFAEGEFPALAVTSPPYPGAEMWETEAEQLIEVGANAMALVYKMLPEGGVLAWNTSDMARGNAGYACNIARETMLALGMGFRKRGEVIWDKGVSYMPLPGFTRRPTVPNNTHEAILVFFKGDWKPREKRGNLNDEQMLWNRETVWKIGTERASKMGHIAPFPLALAARCVALWSLENDIVYEPFLGSGTTLIACEQSGRFCRAMEIDPAYAAISIDRFYCMTGVRPLLME